MLNHLLSTHVVCLINDVLLAVQGAALCSAVQSAQTAGYVRPNQLTSNALQPVINTMTGCTCFIEETALRLNSSEYIVCQMPGGRVLVCRLLIIALP